MTEDNDVRGSIAKALAEFQVNLPKISKSQRADTGTFSYTYADLAQVTDAVLPALAKVGLAWLAKPTTIDGKMGLHYKLMHISGEVEDGFYQLPSASTPQQMGSALTYARRQCLCSVTGVAPEDDDDAAAAEPQTNTARRQQQTAQRAARPAGNGQRTAQRARPAGPPLPGEEGSGPSNEQLKKLHTILTNHGVKDRNEVLDIISRVVSRPITTSKEMLPSEVSYCIDKLDGVEDFEAWLAALIVSTTPEEEPAEDGTLM